MRKLLAILFLSIFTIQMLPIEAIGKILWNGQMTEEVHENGHCHKKMTGEADKLWYLNFAPVVCHAPVFNGFHGIIRDEALIKCLHLEVPIQPPNFG